MIHGLDLFSGGGGLAEGLRRWVKTVAYCEIERGAQRVLLSRMARGEIDAAPIWDDVSTLRGTMLPTVDIIAGGFPCQDISVAGNGAGLEGKRSGLVFEYLRLIGDCRPRFVFMENVPALTIWGLDRVLLGLYALGYDARWTIVSAAEVGAPHRRERIWILAHANSFTGGDERKVMGRRDSIMGQREAIAINNGYARDLADPHGPRHRSHDPSPINRKLGLFGRRIDSCRRTHWWETEPDVGRVADGVADRSNRLRVLGNGVVPLCAEEAFARLGGFLT